MSGSSSDLRLSKYYGLVLDRLRKDIRPRVEWMLIALFVGILGALLLDRFGLVAKGQILLRITVATIPAVLIAAAYFLWHAVMAPWKVHNERYAETMGELKALRIKFDAEVAQNQVPKITGEASNFQVTGRRSPSDFGIACDLYLCNTRPVTTTLRRVEFDATQIQPALALSQYSISEVTLERGIGKRVKSKMTLTFEEDIDPHYTVDIDLTALGVYAVDAFGNQHALTVQAGTRLFLSSGDHPFFSGKGCL